MGEKKPPAGGHRNGGNANQHATLNHPAGRSTTSQYGHEQLLDALHHIPADLSRDKWWRILASAKSAGLNEAEVRAWSATGASFNERRFADTWRSLTADAGIGPGTLVSIARQHGWSPDPNAPPPRRLSAAELAQQKAEREAKAAQAAAERRAKADAAAADARQRLAAAGPADPAHTYLKRKGVAPVPTLRQDGAALVIPFENHAGTRGVQIITPDGQKLFQRGASFKGCWWWARPPADGVAAPLIIITEGVADALTVAAAVNEAAVACALSASNLTAVAGALRRCWPAAKIIVAADADEVGRAAAEKAQAADPRLIVRFPSFDRAR